MKLKLNEQGAAVVQDGKPVYVADDGKEIAFDAPHTIATISRLNAENKGHRERAESLDGKLKTFEGIEDPKAALKALSVVKNLDDKKLVDAGEVEKVKTETIKAVEEKYAPIVKENVELKNTLFTEKVGGAFNRSKFITEKVAIPADLMQARFGDRFKYEDGKIVAYDTAGNKIFSRAKPGDMADVDEALEILVDQYPYKEQILKGTGNSGGGGRPANGGGNGGGPAGTALTKAELNKGSANEVRAKRSAFLNAQMAAGKSPAEARAALDSLPEGTK